MEAGAGVGILATKVVRRDVDGGYLRALRIRGGDFVMTLSLAYHRERGHSPLLRTILAGIPDLSRTSKKPAIARAPGGA